MAEIKAVSSIKHIPYKEGRTDAEKRDVRANPTWYEIGDTLTDKDFTEDELRQLVEGGSAVELGKNRRFSPEPDAASAAAAADAATRLRDQLIAESLSVPNEQPKAVAAAATEQDAETTRKGGTPPPAAVK